MSVSGGTPRRLCTILRRVSALRVTGQQLSGHLSEIPGNAPVSYVHGTWPRGFFTSPFGNSTNSACSMLAAQNWDPSLCSLAHFSTEADKESTPSESTQELYDKLLKSVEAKTMPPNAWLWSLIENCNNKEDIKLLFQILQRLRVFRLSNLRIHANFNIHLSSKITEACVRSGALENGMKALWKHNVYGLTPTISSLHCLLLHAKKHSDIKLLAKIMDIIKKNSMPLQPGTADIVFSICYNSRNWRLLLKYAKRFIKAGVKLHRAAYDNLMEFAAKMGDAESIWKSEQHRSKHLKSHTLGTAFACAKAYLIERKPDDAAAIIRLLYQELPDSKKPFVAEEVQKLVSEWPSELLGIKKGKDKEELAEFLELGVSAMVDSLRCTGIDLGDLKC